MLITYIIFNVVILLLLTVPLIFNILIMEKVSVRGYLEDSS